MIASRPPVFAKLDRAGRELANLDAFLARYDALPPIRPPPGDASPRSRRPSTTPITAWRVSLAIANDVDGVLPTGDTSHQDLLDQMRAEIPGLRPAVLDDDLYVALTELKGFRHRVRHDNGFDLDPARTEQNRVLMQATFPKFVDAVRTLNA